MLLYIYESFVVCPAVQYTRIILLFGLVVFYGISTIFGYLMPDLAQSAGAVEYTDFVSAER